MILKGALVAALIAVGLAVGAWATSWYKLQSTIGSSTTTTQFFWTDYTTTDSNGNAKTLKYTDDSTIGAPSLPTIANTFSNCLAFLTAGAACMIATIVYQGVHLAFKVGKGSKACKIIGQLIVTAGMVLLAVSFFSFLNITKAFLTDQWSACRPLLSTDYNHYNCVELMGSNPQSNSPLPNTNYVWGPDIGWWLLLGSLAVSMFAVGGVLGSRRN